MTGFYWRFSEMFLVAVTAAGCSGAGTQSNAEADATPADESEVIGDEQAVGSDPARPSAGDPRRLKANDDFPSDDDVDADEPTGTTPGADGMPPSGDGGGLDCTCDIALPGIQVSNGADGLTITLELPDQPPMVVHVERGSAQTLEDRLQAEGDMTLDLGNAGTLSLHDARLRADVAGGVMSFTADAARVSGLDTSTLPLTTGVMELNGAHVEMVPGVGDAPPRLQVSGDVPDLGAAVWAPELPLSAASALSATAFIEQGVTTRAELSGDVDLGLDALSSAGLPLSAATVPNAAVTFDQEGLTVSGPLSTSIDPRLPLPSVATITAVFTERDGGWQASAADWEIQLSGAPELGPLLGPLLDPLQLPDCVSLDVAGVQACHD